VWVGHSCPTPLTLLLILILTLILILILTLILILILTLLLILIPTLILILILTLVFQTGKGTASAGPIPPCHSEERSRTRSGQQRSLVVPIVRMDLASQKALILALAVHLRLKWKT
jgi:hypothetical protein